MSSNIITNSRDPHVGIFEEALVYHHSQDPQGTHFCKHISQWWLLHSESDSGEASQSTASEGQPINSWAPYEASESERQGKCPWGDESEDPVPGQFPGIRVESCKCLHGERRLGRVLGAEYMCFPPLTPDKFISWMLIPSEAVFGEGTLKDVIKCK